MPFKLDKQFIFEVIIILLLLGVGAWLYFGGALEKISETPRYARPGTCLILPQQYCNQGVSITYLGNEALGFNLPEGTPIYMPFDGAYFDETPEGKDFSRIRLGIIGTSSFVVIVGKHAPFSEPNLLLEKGDLLATVNVAPENEPVDFSSDSNVVIYAEDYDLLSLF